MLHVTNGDSVIASFHAGHIPGEYLPWRDVLHDGPVPRRDSLEALSDVRAAYLADTFGGAGYEAALRAASNVDEFKLRVQGISTTSDMSRDQMAQSITAGKAPEITRFSS